MNKIHKWSGLALGMLLSLAVSSCDVADDTGQSLGPDAATKAYVSVRLQIASTDGTRSPNGGEDGDGREPGVNHENEIDNVTLLLYKSADGINTADPDGEVKIETALYFEQLTAESSATSPIEKVYVTEKKECDIVISDDCHAIVVANMGDMSGKFVGKPLSEVRDHLITNAWTPGAIIAEYDKFVMTSEKDASFEGVTPTINNNNIEYEITTTIERVAARIDFMHDNELQTVRGETGLVYDVVDKKTNGEKIGYFLLTYIVPFNQLNSGSYLIKRVYDQTENNTTYLGDELPNPFGVQTNYVVDPYWWTDRSQATYLRLYQYAEQAKQDFNDYSYRWAAKETDQSSTLTGGATENYYILDYTQENTSDNNSTQYATGLIFRGTYYSDAYWNNGNPETDGETRTYVYYIRHSDMNDDYTNGPMLYGIVRNNIYRVKVERVIEEPDESGLKLSIKVREWASFEHSGIVM